MKKYTEIIKEIDCCLEDKRNEQFAYITHFLQNSDIYSGCYYKDSALETLENSHIKLPFKWDIPFPQIKDYKFTFIDLFSGIGGFRIALQELGGKCIFSSDIDKQARKVYKNNFGDYPFGDITKINKNIIPPHDILVAGFPCQPFSISGLKKGFEDIRGTLIFDILEIIKLRSPKIILLENVKHLKYHDNGRTLETMVKHLEKLEYKVSVELLNASDFGVPQNRERIMIIGNKSKKFDFSVIEKKPKPILENFLEKNATFEYIKKNEYTLIDDPKIQKSGLIFSGFRKKKIRKSGVRSGTEHLSRVHKQPNRIYSSKGVHPALPSQETSGRFWILHNNKVRKLTVNECYKIMGFPDVFIKSKVITEQYKQIGNSVCVPMMVEVGDKILSLIKEK